jgi:hypothetical protein
MAYKPCRDAHCASVIEDNASVIEDDASVIKNVGTRIARP